MASMEFNPSRETNVLHLTTHESRNMSISKKIQFPIAEPAHPLHLKLIQSCQGLVCLSDSEFRYTFICNPFRRDITACAPVSRDGQCLGFGYAATAKKFKVVRYVTNNEDETECDIFTLNTGEWRHVHCPPSQSKHCFSYGAPFLCGAIHLLPCFEDPKIDDMIHTFDMETEDYGVIPLPAEYYSVTATTSWTWESLYLELKGFLCAVFQYQTCMDLLLLKDYKSGKWVKQYKININLENFSAEWEGPFVLMASGDLLLNLTVAGEKNLYCYNCIEKAFKWNTQRHYSVTVHADSLSPVN